MTEIHMNNVINFPKLKIQKQIPDTLAVIQATREWVESDSRVVDMVTFVRDPETGDFLPIVTSVQALQALFDQFGMDVELQDN